MAVIISLAIVIGVISAPQMGIQTYATYEWDFKIDKLKYKINNKFRSDNFFRNTMKINPKIFYEIWKR